MEYQASTFSDWYSTGKKLPETSGRYLVRTMTGDVKTLEFSAVHQVFNSNDWATDEEAADTAIECDWWTEVPNLPEKGWIYA